MNELYKKYLGKGLEAYGMNVWEDGKEKVAAEMKSPQNNSPKDANLAREIRKAGAEGNAESMATKIAELEKIEANSPYLPGLKLDLLMVKKDWPAVTKAISDLPPGPAKQMSVMMTASKIAGSADGAYPPDFVKFMAFSFAETIENSEMPANSMILTNLSRLQWKSGDKQAATASANKAAEAAKTAKNQTKGRELPPEPFNRFAKSVASGTMPTAQELSSWLSEEMKNPPQTRPAKRIRKPPTVRSHPPNKFPNPTSSPPSRSPIPGSSLFLPSRIKATTSEIARGVVIFLNERLASPNRKR